MADVATSRPHGAYFVPVAKLQRHRALLGRLAGLGWFTQHGEVAATQSVAVLLREEPALRDALLRHLGTVTSTDLGAVRLFQAELVQDDLARPDLVGWDDRDQPRVIVEAKFGASLTSAQLQAYMTHQIAKLDAGTRGVLTVLVPSYRRPEAEAVLSAVGDEGAGSTAVIPSVSASVLTWEELLSVLEGAVAKVPADDRDAVRCACGKFERCATRWLAWTSPRLAASRQETVHCKTVRMT